MIKYFLMVTLMLFQSTSKPSKFIKYSFKSTIDITEPSDICYDETTSTFYVVSDEGTIKIKDRDLHTLKTLRYKGSDFEAVCVVDTLIYVSDESGKQVIAFSTRSNEIVTTYDIRNIGGLNAGIEGLTYNSKTSTFIGSYEKDPVVLIEYDKNFHEIKKINMKKISDISALTFHRGYLYVLSDEDASLSKVDPTSYQVLNTVYFDIINPEGVTFIGGSDSFLVVSDAMQKIYTFNAVGL
jgi:uncharacterized protein YjiK